MLPVAPGLFSTMTWVPHFLLRPSASRRATVSDPTPAGQATTMVICLSIGHFADATDAAAPRSPTATAHAAMALRMMRMLPPGSFILGAGLGYGVRPLACTEERRMRRLGQGSDPVGASLRLDVVLH